MVFRKSLNESLNLTPAPSLNREFERRPDLGVMVARERRALRHEFIRFWPRENRTFPSFFYFLPAAEADKKVWLREKRFLKFSLRILFVTFALPIWRSLGVGRLMFSGPKTMVWTCATWRSVWQILSWKAFKAQLRYATEGGLLIFNRIIFFSIRFLSPDESLTTWVV